MPWRAWASGIDAIDLVKSPLVFVTSTTLAKPASRRPASRMDRRMGFSSMRRILSAASGGRGVTGWRGGARFVLAMVGCAVHTVIGFCCVHTMAGCYAHDDAAPQQRTQRARPSALGNG